MTNLIKRVFELPLSFEAKGLLCYLIGIGKPYPPFIEIGRVLGISHVNLTSYMAELSEQKIIVGSPDDYTLQIQEDKPVNKLLELIKNAPTKSQYPKGVLELINFFRAQGEKATLEVQKNPRDMRMIRLMVKEVGAEQVEKLMRVFYLDDVWKQFSHLNRGVQKGRTSITDFQKFCLSRPSLRANNPKKY